MDFRLQVQSFGQNLRENKKNKYLTIGIVPSI